MHGDTNNVDVDTEHLQIISTCKHFAGYDIETGRSGNNVNISARMLTEYYLPVFKTCVQVAKVKSIMCTYSAQPLTTVQPYTEILFDTTDQGLHCAEQVVTMLSMEFRPVRTANSRTTLFVASGVGTASL